MRCPRPGCVCLRIATTDAEGAELLHLQVEVLVGPARTCVAAGVVPAKRFVSGSVAPTPLVVTLVGASGHGQAVFGGTLRLRVSSIVVRGNYYGTADVWGAHSHTGTGPRVASPGVGAHLYRVQDSESARAATKAITDALLAANAKVRRRGVWCGAGVVRAPLPCAVGAPSTCCLHSCAPATPCRWGAVCARYPVLLSSTLAPGLVLWLRSALC
jgi:hypothetical protein